MHHDTDHVHSLVGIAHRNYDLPFELLVQQEHLSFPVHDVHDGVVLDQLQLHSGVTSLAPPGQVD